jgi:hypothetical protein
MEGVTLGLLGFLFSFGVLHFSSQNPFSFFLLLTGFLIGNPLHFVWLMPIFRFPRSWSSKALFGLVGCLPGPSSGRQDGVSCSIPYMIRLVSADRGPRPRT